MLEALRSWAPLLALLAMTTVALAAPLAFGSHVVVQGRAGRLATRWWWLLVALCAGAVGLGLLALILLLL